MKRIIIKSIFLVFFCSPLTANDLLGLPDVTIPTENSQTETKIKLGRLLFNDARLSGDGTISCASCHQPEKAFTDGLPVAKGIKKQQGTRNAPTVINSAFYQTFFHDGRAASLEEQTLGPFLNPIEHGLKDRESLVEIVKKDKKYLKMFAQVFGVPEDQITAEHIAKAIASFERTLISGNSLFDQYFYGRKRELLSESAARGSRIFRRKGNCSNCHEMNWKNAFFSDNNFYNIGVGSKILEPVLDGFLEKIRSGVNPDDIKLADQQHSELGRFNVTKIISDIGKFKTPSLRNVALTGPYMHDGSISTLEEVIEYYDKGGDKNRFKDPAIFPLKLTEQEKKDLVAFLRSLTSSKYLKSQDE